MPYRVKFPGARTERGPDELIPGSPISTTPATLATTGNASSTATNATETQEPSSFPIQQASIDAGLDASEREVSQQSTIEQEPREAEALLNLLLDMGCTFKTLHQDGKDWLIWFGPRVSIAPTVREQLAEHKVEILSLFRNGSPQSRRQWGEPEGFDWQEHPQPREDCE